MEAYRSPATTAEISPPLQKQASGPTLVFKPYFFSQPFLCDSIVCWPDTTSTPSLVSRRRFIKGGDGAPTRTAAGIIPQSVYGGQTTQTFYMIATILLKSSAMCPLRR